MPDPIRRHTRILSGCEWARLERGIEHRVRATKAFLRDNYHRRKSFAPARLVSQNKAFLPKMIGVTPWGDFYTHIVGVGWVWTGENELFVL